MQNHGGGGAYLNRLRPLPRVDRRVDGLQLLVGLNVVVDGGVHLLLVHQPVAPLVLQRDDVAGEHPARQIDSAAVRMPAAVRLDGTLVEAQLLEEVAGLLEHRRLAERRRDRLLLLLRDGHLVRVDDVRRLRRQAAGQVQVDRLDVLALALAEVCRLVLLLRLHQPLVVRLAHLVGVLVALRLRHRNRLVEPEQLFPHGHGLVHFVPLEVDRLGRLEVLVQHLQRRTHRVVFVAVLPDHAVLAHRLLRELADLVQRTRLRHVAERREAPLCNVQLAVLQGKLRQVLPHGLRLRGDRDLLEQVAGLLVVAVLHRRAELDQALVEPVRGGVDAFVDDHLSLAIRTLNVLDVALNGHDRHPVRRFNRVPHAQVAAVLCHHHVAVRHPRHERAVVQQGDLRLRRDVVQEELARLVLEEQLRGTLVQLQPVELRVVLDGRDADSGDEVEDADGLAVHEVRDDLLPPLIVRVRRVVHTHAEEVRRDVLRAARPEDLVAPVLDEGEFADVEDHAHERVVEDELLVPAARPRHLGHLARTQVADEQRGRAVRHQVQVLVHVHLHDLVAELRLQHDARACAEPLHDHLRVRHVRELELALVQVPADARVVHVDAAAQRRHDKPRPVVLPRRTRDGEKVLKHLVRALLPLVLLDVVVEHTQLVEPADHKRVPRRVERAAHVLLVLRRVVGKRLLQPAAARLVERHLAVVADRRHALPPRQPLRHARVRAQLGAARKLPRLLEVVAVDRAVHVPADQPRAVLRRRDAHHVRVGAVEVAAFVRRQRADAHLAVGAAEDQELVAAHVRPRHAGDGAVLHELVADALPLSPVVPELVHKHNVVALRNRQLRRVRREHHAPHHVRLRAPALDRFCAEPVPLVTVLVEQVHEAVVVCDGQPLVVRAPAGRCDARDMGLRRLQVLCVAQLHCVACVLPLFAAFCEGLFFKTSSASDSDSAWPPSRPPDLPPLLCGLLSLPTCWWWGCVSL